MINLGSWSSAHSFDWIDWHTDNLDAQLNFIMRTMTACTYKNNSHTLVQQHHANWKAGHLVYKNTEKILDNGKLLIHNFILAASPVRLKSRHPTIRTAKTLHNENLNIDQSWGLAWNQAVTSEVSKHFDVSSKPIDFDLPCRIWKTNKARPNCSINRTKYQTPCVLVVRSTRPLSNSVNTAIYWHTMSNLMLSSNCRGWRLNRQPDNQLI